MNEGHDVRVDSIDYKTNEIVWICDDCGFTMRQNYTDCVVEKPGDWLVEHRGSLGGLSIDSTDVLIRSRPNGEGG